MANTVLNFPIETEDAKKFWASSHKLNKAKAIIAFSLDEKNANDNMRRYGYKYFWRQRALKAYKQYINNPSMSGVPFSEMGVNWWDEI